MVMPTLASATSTEIDSALSQSQTDVASSNMTSAAVADAQVKLDLALHQRQAHEFEQANQTLISMMKADIPYDLKRTALLELALTAQDSGKPARALQIFAQYLQRFPDDPGVPEVMLRQALLYREMGAYRMALSKFYAVMTTILNLKLDTNGYYKRLVLQAQTEIADTHYLQGNFDEAADFFNRLLKLDAPELNKPEIRLKLVRSLSASGRHEETVREAQELLAANPNNAEARFLLAVSLQHLGHKQEAMRQALLLLETPEGQQWKQFIGNQIANTFYAEGDYSDALVVYHQLDQDDSSPEWRIPILYQIGLIQERLQKTDEAIAAYGRVGDLAPGLGKTINPALQVVLDMSQWRKKYLAWQAQMTQAQPAVSSLPAPATKP